MNARLTATVDLPTPPLHDETAMTWRTAARPPGRPSSPASPSTGGGGGAALIVTSTDVANGSADTAAVASRLNSSLTGQAGVVSSSVKEMAPESAIVKFLTKPAVTMSTPRSGSGMVARAARTAAAGSAAAGWWVGEEGRGVG